jgi:hypothetical protein
MKCSNPDCNRGIGLVAYRRGWFSKRRCCSRNCRDAFVTDLPKRSEQERRVTMAGDGFTFAVITHTEAN